MGSQRVTHNWSDLAHKFRFSPLYDLPHSVGKFVGLPLLLQMVLFCSFLWLNYISLYLCTTSFYLFPFWWTFMLLPYSGYCELCCNEYCSTYIFSNNGFSPDIYLGVGLLDHIFSCLRSVHTDLHSGWTSLHCQLVIPCSPHPSSVYCP